MGFFEDIFQSEEFQFVAGLGLIVGGILTGNPQLVVIGIGLVAAALSGRPDHEAIFQNRGSTQASLPVVYGTTKIGAKLVDTRDDPTNETDLHRVLAFCVGSENGQGIEGVGEVFFDEERAITDAVAGTDPLTAENIDDFWVDGGQVKLGYSLQLGTDDQVVDSGLHSIWPTAWPTTSKGNGIVWMNFLLRRDEDPSNENKYRGIPNVTAEIQGNRVYDPRDPTGGPNGDGYVFSNNPALCLLDYLASKRYGAGRPYGDRDVATVGTPQVSASFSHPEGDTTVNIEAEAGESLSIQIGTRITFSDHPHVYTTQTVIELTGPETKAVVLDRGLEAALSGGEEVLAADPSVIDEASFIAAANYCDEQITVPRTGGQETQDRFTADVWLDTGDAIARNIAVLESACRGNLVYERGQYRLVIRKAQAPVEFVLNEDNIIGDWAFSRSGAEDTPNQITVRHPDKDRRFTTQEITWPERGQNPYIEEDGGWENNRDLKLPATTDRLRAEQIGMTMLKEARADRAATLRATEAAMVLSVGDVVPVTHDLPGWEEKEFFVTTMGLRPDATVELALREYDPDAYLIGEQEVPDEVPDPDLPPIPCPPGSEPSFTEDLIAQYGNPLGGVICDPDGGFGGRASFVTDWSGNGNTAGITKGAGTPRYAIEQDTRCDRPRKSRSNRTIKTGADGDPVISSQMLRIPGSVVSPVPSNLRLTNDGRGFTLSGSFKIKCGPLHNQQNLFGQLDTDANEGFEIIVNACTQNKILIRWHDSGGTLNARGLTLPDDIPTVSFDDVLGNPCPTGDGDLVGPWVDFSFSFFPFGGGLSQDTGLVVVFMDAKLQGVLEIGKIVTPTSAELAVAGIRGDDPTQHNFNGAFDEIFVWNKALSLCEVRAFQGDLCAYLDGRVDLSDGGEPLLRLDFDTTSPIDITLETNYTNLPQVFDPLYQIFLDWYEDGVLVAQHNATDLIVEEGSSWGGGTVTRDLGREFTLTADEGGEASDTHSWRVDATIVDRGTGETLASSSTGGLYVYSAGQTEATATVTTGGP